MFNLEISTADIAEESDGASAAQPPVCQMVSAPGKSSPDSPEDICVKLMMSLAGILEGSWDDKINPPMPWEAKGHAIWEEGHTHDLADEKSCRAQLNASLLSQVVISQLGKGMQLILLALSVFSYGGGFFFFTIYLLWK